MLEFLLCSLVTIFPDFLVRRYVQGKRWGQEINFFTMWYELRCGITACVMLTILLITLIFYYHPSTSHASPFFRTLTLLPETGGRVEEVFVQNLQEVKAGDALFTIKDDTQSTALESARSRVLEIDAQFLVAESSRDEALAQIEEVTAELEQERNELRMRLAVAARDPSLVSKDQLVTYRNRVASAEGRLAGAIAALEAAMFEVNTILPAQRSTALDEVSQAEAELEKTTIYASTTGRLQQFALRPGDYVSPIMRPAGLLIPTESHLESGRSVVQAGFGQLAAPVLKRGTLAEMTCLSKPFTVVPMIVTEVVDVIATGQLRPTDVLIDAKDRAVPGTLTVLMEPLYEDGMSGILPGTKCIVNAYSFHHEELEAGDLGTFQSLAYHTIDTVGVVHAIILRIQTLILPVKTLVFSGH